MSFKNIIKDFWAFLKEDSWQSWLVSIILIVVGIKFIFFPLMALITGTALPLVVVESCSMYHESSFDEWWNQNSVWYESKGIMQSEFKDFSFKNGLNKGDIILVWGYSNYNIGDIMIFNAPTKYPIIHRIISLEPLSTKGDHNVGQIEGIEKDIKENAIIGKAIAKIPYLGWVKLIFFEPFKSREQRGFCN